MCVVAGTDARAGSQVHSGVFRNVRLSSLERAAVLTASAAHAIHCLPCFLDRVVGPASALLLPESTGLRVKHKLPAACAIAAQEQQLRRAPIQAHATQPGVPTTTSREQSITQSINPPTVPAHAQGPRAARRLHQVRRGLRGATHRVRVDAARRPLNRGAAALVLVFVLARVPVACTIMIALLVLRQRTQAPQAIFTDDISMARA